MDFVTKTEWADIQTLPDDSGRVIVNEILTRLFNKAVETSLRSMPELISRLIEQQGVIGELTKKFFSQNPEFAKYKNVVSATITDIEEANPGDDYSTILTKATAQIKNKINILESANQTSLDFGD